MRVAAPKNVNEFIVADCIRHGIGSGGERFTLLRLNLIEDPGYIIKIFFHL